MPTSTTRESLLLKCIQIEVLLLLLLVKFGRMTAYTLSRHELKEMRSLSSCVAVPLELGTFEFFKKCLHISELYVYTAARRFTNAKHVKK